MKTAFLFVVLLLTSCVHFLSKKEKEEEAQKEKSCEAIVSSWIKKHALYPGSYEPVSFDHFTEAYESENDNKITGTESYTIHHVHRMKDVNGQMAEFSGWFTIDSDSFMVSVTNEATAPTSFSFPPDYSVWTSQFGRPANAADTAELEAKQGKQLEELLRIIRDSTVIDSTMIH